MCDVPQSCHIAPTIASPVREAHIPNNDMSTEVDLFNASYARSLCSKGGDFRTDIMADDDPDYIGLSRRFALWAERATDPLLAESYRKLSQTYRALDFWHERFRERYKHLAEDVATPDRVRKGSHGGH